MKMVAFWAVSRRKKRMMGYDQVTGLIFDGADWPNQNGRYNVILCLGDMIYLKLIPKCHMKLFVTEFVLEQIK